MKLSAMNVLGMFVKQPLAGHVKTRLAAELGKEGASALYAAFVADLAERLRAIGDRRLLCFAPDDDAARQYFRNLAGDDYELWPQPETLLGERMHRFFDECFDASAERVVVIGSDSPTLPAGLLVEAFHLLAENDCVLGPASDGGYYLIGLSRRCRPLFDNVDWSSPRVLDQTVSRIEQTDAKLAVLTPWYDVDTADDLHLLRGHLRALRVAGAPIALPRTESCLSRQFHSI